jgi:hypothetical protein
MKNKFKLMLIPFCLLMIVGIISIGYAAWWEDRERHATITINMGPIVGIGVDVNHTGGDRGTTGTLLVPRDQPENTMSPTHTRFLTYQVVLPSGLNAEDYELEFTISSANGLAVNSRLMLLFGTTNTANIAVLNPIDPQADVSTRPLPTGATTGGGTLHPFWVGADNVTGGAGATFTTTGGFDASMDELHTFHLYLESADEEDMETAFDITVRYVRTDA